MKLVDLTIESVLEDFDSFNDTIPQSTADTDPYFFVWKTEIRSTVYRTRRRHSGRVGD